MYYSFVLHEKQNIVDYTFAGSLFRVIIALTSCNQVVFFDCDDVSATCKLRNFAGLTRPDDLQLDSALNSPHMHLIKNGQNSISWLL